MLGARGSVGREKDSVILSDQMFPNLWPGYVSNFALVQANRGFQVDKVSRTQGDARLTRQPNNLKYAHKLMMGETGPPFR